MSATTIHVGDGGREYRSFADFTDGETGLVKRVEISFAPGHLQIELPDGDTFNWALEQVRRLPDQAGEEVSLTSIGHPLARLHLREAGAIRTLEARCPDIARHMPVRGLGRIAIWASGAVGSVALILFLLVPLLADQLATLLPPEGEKALGDTTFEQIRGAMSETEFGLRVCNAPAGRAALDKMLARLEPALNLPYPLTVNVLDHPMINAFALPGGYVTFFDGLIQAAGTPEEVAAVFAHEIGHVAHRDPTRSALRTAGSIGILGLVFGDFAGGTVILFMTNRLIEASYSQDAETAADSYAHSLMAAADLPAGAMADMFERLRRRHGDTEGVAAHFAAHPKLIERIRAARAADRTGGENTRPILNRKEWQALRRICRDGG